MITTYTFEDIWFDEPPNGDAVSSALDSLFSDTEDTSPYKGISDKDLNDLYTSGQISEQDYRDELAAKKIGPKEIDRRVDVNKPKPTTQGPMAQLENAAIEQARATVNPQESLEKLSETDILNQVKAGSLSPEEGVKVLVRDKGYSLQAAMDTVKPIVAAKPTAAQSAMATRVNGLGITDKVSDADIIKGAKMKLWSPDDAYEALMSVKGHSAQEAATILKLAGWKQGNRQQGVAKTPGELMARSGVTGQPADLMARSGGGLSGLAPVTIQRPKIQGAGLVTAEDGSRVPASFYGG